MHEFLDGAEWAEPAAKYTPSPEQDTQCYEPPEDEYDRIQQQRIPGEAGREYADKGDDVNDRELTQTVVANKKDGVDQKRKSEGVKETGVYNHPVLEEQ